MDIQETKMKKNDYQQLRSSNDSIKRDKLVYKRNLYDESIYK